MTMTFTNEEMKEMKSLIKFELDEAVRTLNGYGYETPANIGYIKSLRNKVATYKAMLEKINGAQTAQ